MLVLLACLLLTGCRPAVEERDVLPGPQLWVLAEDDGPLVFDQARSRDFTPYSGLRVSGAPVWVRVDLPPSPAPETWLLRIRPGNGGSIDVHDPERAGQAVLPELEALTVTGRSVSRLVAVPHTAYGRSVWLRLGFPGVNVISVRVDPLSRGIKNDNVDAMAAVAFTGLLFSVAVWGGWIFFQQRTRSAFAFALLQATAVVWVAQVSGLMFAAGVWPAASRIPYLVSTGLLLVMLWQLASFNVALLTTYGAPAGPLLALRAVTWLFPVELALWAVVGDVMAVALAALAGLFQSFMCLAVAVWVWLRPRQSDWTGVPPWALALFYGVSLIVQNVSGDQWLGSEYAFYSFMVNMTIRSGVLLAMQIAMANAAARQRAAAAAQARDTEIALRREQYAREQQSTLLAMLTHELKNALAVLRIEATAPDSPARNTRLRLAMGDMVGVLDRCSQAEAVTSGGLDVRKADADLALEAEEICGAPGYERVLVRAEARLPHLQTDVGLYRIILTNLVENAVKYGAPTRDIDVQVRLDERDGRPGILTAVTNDAGPGGMPDPSQVFTRYYRSVSARQFTGSGLGLYLSSHIAGLLGGMLTFSPVDGRVRFLLWLPI